MNINLDGLPPRGLLLISDYLNKMCYEESAAIDCTVRDMASAGQSNMVVDNEMKAWGAAYLRVAREAREAYQAHLAATGVRTRLVT